jgi:hypothetical protein
VRTVVRILALFLLTFVGSVEGVRMAVVPALQACVCGCGAPSDDLCACKGPVQPAIPASSQTPKPCSEPSRGCSSTLVSSTGILAASKKAEEPAKNPDPKPEPRPWPLRVAEYGGDVVSSMLLAGFGSWDNLPPVWRGLQRLAWLSTFRN